MDLNKFFSYLIINIPVILFVLLGMIFITMSLKLKNYWFLIGAWWAFSGATLLGIDFFKRKRADFCRLLVVFKNDRQIVKLKSNLKQTICGISMLLALKYRLKSGI